MWKEPRSAIGRESRVRRNAPRPEGRPRHAGADRGTRDRRSPRRRQGRGREAARAPRREDRRAPVPALRRGPPKHPARPPGARRLREGRRRPARVRRRQPDGRPGHVVQGAGRSGDAARLPVAHPRRAAGARRDRRVQPLALRGRRRGQDVRPRPGEGLAAPLRAHPRVRAHAGRRGDHGAEGVPQRLPRRAARAVPGADRRPRETLEVPARRPRRCASASTTGSRPGRRR